jgi:precorrin-6x reductase
VGSEYKKIPIYSGDLSRTAENSFPTLALERKKQGKRRTITRVKRTGHAARGVRNMGRKIQAMAGKKSAAVEFVSAFKSSTFVLFFRTDDNAIVP